MRFKTRRKERKKLPKTKETYPLASSSVVVVSHFEGRLRRRGDADGDRRRRPRSRDRDRDGDADGDGGDGGFRFFSSAAIFACRLDHEHTILNHKKQQAPVMLSDSARDLPALQTVAQVALLHQGHGPLLELFWILVEDP